jgi:hypothetical protein
MGRKKVAGAALCVTAMVSLNAGTALVGEVTGNGENLKPLSANSICAYSGLDDADDDGFGRTQNWGQLSKEDRAFLTSVGAHPG